MNKIPPKSRDDPAINLFICCPEGPKIEKIQSREALLKKSSFEYGMKFQSRMVFPFRAPLWPQKKNKAQD